MCLWVDPCHVAAQNWIEMRRDCNNVNVRDKHKNGNGVPDTETRDDNLETVKLWESYSILILSCPCPTGYKCNVIIIIIP